MKRQRKCRQFSGSNRRRYPRFDPSALPLLRNAALQQGSEIQIIDISKGGMLLTTDVRLRPQVKILLKLVTGKGIYKIAGQVLRSSIISLDGKPRYQSAISLDHTFDELDELRGAQEEQIQKVPPEPNAEATFDDFEARLQSKITPGNEISRDQAILTVTAHNAQGVLLQESFELNDW